MNTIPNRSTDDNAVWHVDDVVLEANPAPKAWEVVWRKGLAPQLSARGLRSLLRALKANDSRLITGSTVLPPPLQCNELQQVQALCPLCWALANGISPSALCVGSIERAFAECCFRADELLGEPAAVRYWLNAVDGWTRDELLANLVPEVQRTLAERDRLGREEGAA